jgi:hypothetical protein
MTVPMKKALFQKNKTALNQIDGVLYTSRFDLEHFNNSYGATQHILVYHTESFSDALRAIKSVSSIFSARFDP